MKENKAGKDKLEFGTAFKYPFNRPKGMWNILWILFPIFGWFALGGYSIRIVQEFSKGKFKQLPLFKFKSDMKLGFFMLLKSIPFILAYLLVLGILGIILGLLGIPIWLLSFARVLLEMLIIPILFINFFNKETINSLFEFDKIGLVFSNFGDYIITILKGLLLAVIFMVMIIVSTLG